MARSKRRRRKTRKHRSKRGGNGRGHRTGLGDGDNRKIEQYMADENIRQHDAQDPSVLDEASLIEEGNPEAIARRDAVVEALQRRLDAVADHELEPRVARRRGQRRGHRRHAPLGHLDDLRVDLTHHARIDGGAPAGDDVPSLAELRRRFGALGVGGVVPAHVPVAPVVPDLAADDPDAGLYDDLPLAPRAHEGGRRRRTTRKRRTRRRKRRRTRRKRRRTRRRRR